VLRELTSCAERLALVGLAKNTGKTEALASLLSELEVAGTRVGVTSVGRDGEAHDVIDSRIDKPAVRLTANSLLATTDSLLSASGIPFEMLERTDIRTPLGRVLVVRLKGAGAVEVAGPSGAEQVREVSDAMLAHGAEQVLIDGAIDRRAASRPDVADGLVMSTGAVLGDQLEEIVSITRRAVELVRLPALNPDSPPARLARSRQPLPNGALIDEDLEATELPPRFVLTAGAPLIGTLLDANPTAHWLTVAGALPEAFLSDLAAAVHSRGRSLIVVVADPTRAFLATRDLGWYARQGIALQTVEPISLLALTVNPVAPQSHRLDSAELQSALGEAIEDVPIIDVLERPILEAGRSASA
jgi:hypothetical protein